MGRFFDRNINSDLEILKQQEKEALDEALQNPKNIKDWVQILSLIMNKTNNGVKEQHINYALSRLLDSPTKTEIKTGEGKSYGDMLLLASQILLHQKISYEVVNLNVLNKELEDFQNFFSALGLNTAEILQQVISPLQRSKLP